MMKTPASSSTTSPHVAHSCKIRLFRDEEALVVTFDKQATGEWLVDYICNELNLVEKYYFGLRFTDQNSKRQWLDLAKPLLKQVKDPLKNSICFRVRYYPASPELLREELTRYHLYMQLRRDAYHGRLVPRPADVPLLCALIIQSELGDHDDVELDDGFTKDIDLLPKLAASMEAKIVECYKELSGLTPADTEAKFIDRVKLLETYGIDPQPAKDKTGEMLHIGACHSGVSVFQSFRRIKLFKWEYLLKCSIDGKYVNLVVYYPELDEKHQKKLHKFKCPDEQTAKFLWTNILDQQAFFTLRSRDQAKSIKSGGFFRRSNKFRFSGRCYDEVVKDTHRISRMPPAFVRASSASLNRSLSIRSSKRHLAPPNRHSTHGVPHSKSLPVGFNPTGDNSSTGEQTASLNASEGFIDDVVAPPVLENGNEAGSPHILLTQIMDSTDGAASSRVGGAASPHSGSEDSIDNYQDSMDQDQLMSRSLAKEVVISGQRPEPSYTSTPINNKVLHRLESETTPSYQTTGEPDPIAAEEVITARHTSALSAGPTRTPPQIIITDDKEMESKVKATADRKSADKGLETDEVGPVEEEVAVKEESVEPLHAAASQGAKPVDLKTKPADLKTKPVDLKTKPADLKTKPVDLKTKLADLKTKPVDLRTKSAELKTRSADLKTRSVELRAKPTDFRPKLANLRTKSVDLSTVTTNLETTKTNEITVMDKVEPTSTDVETASAGVETVDAYLDTTGAKPMGNEKMEHADMNENHTEKPCVQYEIIGDQVESVKVNQAMADVPDLDATDVLQGDPDPLSDSTQAKLKLDLTQLGNSSSAEPTPVLNALAPRESSTSKHLLPSLIKSSILALALVVVMLAFVAYIVFESNYVSVKFRHLDSVLYLEEVYYKPIRKMFMRALG